jgi:hypothetical protein
MAIKRISITIRGGNMKRGKNEGWGAGKKIMAMKRLSIITIM